jgi:hypothetical protein
LTHFTMTPNIASVISSASNANGSASAFLFAAASEPEAAFSVPFPEAYARRTTTKRQSQTIHIDPRPRAPLSHPPTRSPLPRLATRVSSHSNSRRPASARARSRRFLTFVVFLPRAAAHTPTRHDHTSSVSAHIPPPTPPPARAFAHHPSPTTASRPSRPRSRPRAHRASPSARVGTAAPLAAFTPREHAHAPSLELARGTDALRFVARVMIPPRERRRRVRARRSPQPYPPRINPSACVVYVCADTGRWCRIMMVCERSTRDHVVGWVGVMSRDPSIESPVIRDGAMNEWER